jgi:1-acyl-sn-glycerol-3-phosphate acyltransferase
MKYLATAYYWILFALTLPTCWLVGVVIFLLTRPFDPTQALLHRWICCYGWLYTHIWPGWSQQVEGRELLPKGPSVIVANHQSSSDIFTVMCIFHPFKFVSKRSVFNVPFLGWLMTMAGYVPVVRKTTDAMERMIADCSRWLRAGVPVLIYPEGTYAPVGQRLPFKRGAFRLAIQEQVPVVPVVLEGTTDMVVGDGPMMGPRARVRVRVLPPIPPSELGTDDAALAARVGALFNPEGTAAATEAEPPLRKVG